MAYPFPGYLDRTADLAGNLIAGFQAGAQVSEAGSRLAAESQRMGIEMAERQQQLQAEQARQQQQMAMTRSYHEAQIGLRRAALEQTQQKIQLSTAQTANKLAEQEGYRRDFAAGKAAGLDDATASRNAMLKHVGMFSSGASLAQLTKPQPQPPQWFPPNPKTGEPGHWVNRQTGSVTHAAQTKEGISEDTRFHGLVNEAKGLQGEIADLEVNKKPTPEQKAKIASKRTELQGIQDDIKKMLRRKQGATGGGIPAKPLPGKKSDLVVGDTYQTQHGPATWNGTQFKRVEVPDFTEEDAQ